MFEEMNKQLEESMEKVFRHRKLLSMLQELTNQQKSLKMKLRGYKEILEKENADVDRLKQKNLTHLFYSILGKLGEQEEKERKEALAAALKYDQVSTELIQIEQQMRQLKDEMLQYGNCQTEYDSLYEKKKELLLEANTQASQKILDLSAERMALSNNQKELEEAIAAGNEVMVYINNAIASLGSAKGWGTFDLIGGGLISDIAKHSHIDDAKREADMIQAKLSSFRTELADVRINNNIIFQTDGFGKFADFFFDGLIADWCMQSRIKETMDSVQKVRGQVQEVMNRLNHIKNAEIEKIGKLEQEINELIRIA